MNVATPSPSARRPVKLLLLGGLALAALALLVAFGASRAKTPTKSRSLGARLELAAGDVSIVDDAVRAAALSGTPLPKGARIQTGKGARALVRTGEGAAVFMRGESEIVLRDKGMAVERGEVWLEAPHEGGEAIECLLGKSVVSASGAGLSIERTANAASVYVARGLSILTTPGGRLEINAGQQGKVVGDAAPTVAAVAFWQDWTGGMGDARGGRASIGSGSGRIYGLDPNASFGAPARTLGIAQQSVRAVVRDGIAETEVDQTFSNPGSTPIEGWYWFTIPSAATVTSFALETDGQLVEGEVIEKREAAAQYAVAVKQRNDPALLEWIDGRSYRARIFPVPASGTRRVVLRYTELLGNVDGKTRYVYPLRSEDPVRFDEFSLSVDLGPTEGVQVATALDARVEEGGRRVTMRRSGYVPRADFQLEMTQKSAPKPVRAWRFESGQDKADYVMLRVLPEVDFAKLPPVKGELVVVVDTSAGGDESARQLRTAAAEATLRALSDQDRFALIALDVAPRVVYPKQGLAPATESDISKALERLSDHAVAGATDLGSMFEPALERLHGAEQPAIVYVGDGAPTSGETGPEALMDRLRRSLTGARARLFSIGVGADARHDLLGQLTRTGGGQHFRIDEAEQVTGAALRLTSAIKTPTLTDVEVDLGAGLDQPFYSSTGKLSHGEELVLLARTHHPLPPKVKMKWRAGGRDVGAEYALSLDAGVTTSLVPRLWAAEYIRRLLGGGPAAEENRSKVLDLGVEYGLMTPYTSILALDSEAAYARQGVQRKRSRLRGVRLTSITSSEMERALEAPFVAPPLSAPAAAMGCSKSEAPATTEQREQTVATAGAKAADHRATTPVASPAPSPIAPADPAPAATATAVAGLGDKGGAPGGLADLERDAPTELKVGAAGGVGGPPRQESLARPRPVAPLTPAPPQAAKGKLEPMFQRPDKSTATARPATLEPAKAPEPVTAWRRTLARCSDSASRPLAERIVLWQRRMKQAADARAVVGQLEMARAACELPDWRDQAAFLDLVQQRVDTEGAAEVVLSHLSGDREAQRFVARAILRRTVDIRLAAAVSRVLFGGIVDWSGVDRSLLELKTPEERVLRVRAAMLRAEGDPQGDLRLVRLLAKAGDRQEALAHGRRLRDRGFMTPSLAKQLGDVLSSAGEVDEAVRTYSEIVEFDDKSPLSRRVLGDVYLRHGWYDAAYRQYKTLTDLDRKSSVGWLRLAAAAAGAGRIDEALRIERDVATGEGSPGPNDPRYWARLWSAARLGALFADPKAAGGDGAREGIGRKLKEQGLFSGPGTMAMLLWEDLDAELVLVAADDNKETLPGEITDAGSTGLYAALMRPDAWGKQAWAVRWKSEPVDRPVRFRVVTVHWDGRAFAVTVQPGELLAQDRQAALKP
ncbi:MAG: hypothetical protein IPG50_00310 [Myxococcales bacterium]|nr:hypothetical protein [Myxococcales bacterium]